MSSQDKKGQRVKNSRRWTNEEKAFFAEVLADTDNNFLVAIEKLALKCSSNEEVFGHIKNLFEIALQDERFIKLNEKKNFPDKKGNLKQYEKLDTSIKKLRNQTKTLKKEWKVIADRVKNGSGLAAGEEPEWYQHINPILAETNEEINPTSSALQTSFVNRDESDLESGSEDEEGIEEHDDENENEGETTSSNTVAKKIKQPAKKLVAAVHQKRSQMCSNKQALSELARAMQNMAESQTKRLKMTLEAEEKREEKKRQERLKEAERNRKHEIEIAKFYAAAFASNNQNSIQATTPTYFAPTSVITRTVTSPQTSPPQRFHSAPPSPLTSSPSIPANFSFQDDPNMSFYRNSKHFS